MPRLIVIAWIFEYLSSAQLFVSVYAKLIQRAHYARPRVADNFINIPHYRRTRSMPLMTHYTKFNWISRRNFNIITCVTLQTFANPRVAYT